MDEGWKNCRTAAERLRWSRLHAKIDTMEEAARRAGEKPGTYRNHEKEIADGGRGFKRETAVRYAEVFKVDLAWLMTGLGSPFSRPSDAEMIAAALGALPPERRGEAAQFALDAIELVKKRGAA